MSRDRYISERLQDIGLDSFPDDTEVTWHLRGVQHRDRYSLIEAEPQPATVGYPRFRFVLSFDASENAEVVGCYAQIGAAWRVLFTHPGASTEWQRLFD